MKKKHRGRARDVALHNVSFGDLRFEVAYADLVRVYEAVLCMRRLDEEAERMYAQGLIRGFCHGDIGQEGVYASLGHVGRGDLFVCSYRCHAMAIAVGVPAREIVAELLGRSGGVSKGKGGSMHLYSDVFFGGHGIVGAQVPLGCGLAYALKYRKDGAGRVVFCIYGDGASNQGQVHESFNMARIWRLPIVFVVLNNAYGMWTPALDVCANDDFYKRADFLPGLRVEGSDVVSAMRCLEFARSHAREKGPIVLQIDTYRFCGHSTTDTVAYRSEEEVVSKREGDPVQRLERILEEALGRDFVHALREGARKGVEKEIAEAMEMDEPGPEELYTDILRP